MTLRKMLALKVAGFSNTSLNFEWNNLKKRENGRNGSKSKHQIQSEEILKTESADWNYIMSPLFSWGTRQGIRQNTLEQISPNNSAGCRYSKITQKLACI